MWTDPIVEEIHRTREEHAKKFNYNLREIFNDLKSQEAKSGRKFVSLPVRRNICKEPKNIIFKRIEPADLSHNVPI